MSVPGSRRKQADLKEMLSKQGTGQAVGDDFVAAFLHAGIPPIKLQHPSIQGVIRKYSSVVGVHLRCQGFTHIFTFFAGCIPAKTQIYSASRRVHDVHIGAIRAQIQNKKVWIGSDEWTSDQGLAIVNILVGFLDKNYVVDTVQVPCKGVQLRSHNAGFLGSFPHRPKYGCGAQGSGPGSD